VPDWRVPVENLIEILDAISRPDWVVVHLMGQTSQAIRVNDPLHTVQLFTHGHATSV